MRVTLSGAAGGINAGGVMARLHWATGLATLAQRFGPRTAVVDSVGEASFHEIASRAAGVGAALLAAGLKPGEQVATYVRNNRHAVAAMYGVQIAGGAETPLNISYTAAECADALAIAGCRLVLCQTEHAALFHDLGCGVFVLDDIAPTPLQAALFPATDPELAGRLAFTSGTTGRPKAVVYRQRTRFIANLALQASLPWLPTGGERVLLMTPFAHGASLQTAAWLEQGGTVVLRDGVQPDIVRAMLEDQRLAALFAAPTVLAKFADVFARRQFRGVRTIFTGTAPLPAPLYDAACAMFGPVVRLTYGKTEVFNPITVLTPDAAAQYYAEGGGTDGSCCVGWPAAGGHLRIDGATEGEVQIRAQHLSDGWLDGDHALQPWGPDGYHPSGDVGRIDARGRLHLVARLSDAMKSGGYKIYPQEIELALGGMGDVVVLGFPSAYWGEIVIAVTDTPRPGWEDAARAACAQLAYYKRPRFYMSVASLPRNGQGKVVRRHLLAALQARWRLEDGAHPQMHEVL